MIFFNDEGTENGGLTFTGSSARTASSPTAATARQASTARRRTCRSISSTRTRCSTSTTPNENGQRLTGISVNDRADVDIYDMVAEQQEIMKIADTVARNAALAKFVAPRNGVPLERAAHVRRKGPVEVRGAQSLRSERQAAPPPRRRFTRRRAHRVSRRGGEGHEHCWRKQVKQAVILMRAQRAEDLLLARSSGRINDFETGTNGKKNGHKRDCS